MPYLFYMTTSAKIPLIDRTVAIKHLSKLITNELDSLQISEQKLGWLMGGLSQGTINKLRQGKFNNIPDFDTLEAIAIYYGQSYSQFMANLERVCPKQMVMKQSSRYILGAIYHIDDVATLAEIADISTTLLKVKLLQVD